MPRPEDYMFTGHELREEAAHINRILLAVDQAAESALRAEVRVLADFYGRIKDRSFQCQIVQKPSDLTASVTVVNQIIEPSPKTVEQEFEADLKAGADLAIKVMRSAE